jgi:hypothetical protein
VGADAIRQRYQRYLGFGRRDKRGFARLLLSRAQRCQKEGPPTKGVPPGKAWLRCPGRSVNLSSDRNCLLIHRLAHALHPWYLTKKPCPLFSAAKPAYFQRFPATAGNEHRWGVVQSVGHLTVNEDGGGSNPPAPAIFIRKQSSKRDYPLAVGNPAETQPFQPPSMDSTLE